MLPSPEPRYFRAFQQRSAGWPASLLALLCGALVTLSLAPFGVWPLGIVATCLLRALLEDQPRRVVIWRSWLFGVGLFGSGTSWVYVSIQQHGNASVMLASFLVVLFCLGLALLFNLTAGVIYSLTNRPMPQANWLLFPAYIVLGEWLKTWVGTGFPWLIIGYAHLETPLAGWAPIAGVLGISFVIALTGSVLFEWLSGKGRRLPMMAASVALLWLGGWLAQGIAWVKPAGEPVQVAMIQPDIPQSIKWQAGAFNRIIQTYLDMSSELWGTDLLIWPEAAIPRLHQNATPLLEQLDEKASQSGTTLITGIPYRDTDSGERPRLYNSVIALGTGKGIYFKQHLVPFGEYVPLENLLGDVIELFDLPMSSFSWGPADQAPLQAGDWSLAPFVCYEVVYPMLVTKDTRRADFILTISNDSWFGRSIGPPQHFEIARMRALENGRYLLRGTNNGISAIVDHRGRVLESAEQFTRTTVRGEAIPMQGHTPFSRTGNTPLIGALLLLFAFVALRQTPER
jgi:apolipoprotein N-acyltransferase